MIIRKEVTKSDLLKLMSKVEEGKHATIPGVEMIPVTAFRYQIKSQPAKLDLNKKSLPKHKTIQNFTIDAQGFRKTKNENPPTLEIEVAS